VMSWYTMAFLGTLPFGNLVAGSLASQIGAPSTLAIGGLFCILGSFLFAKQLPMLRLLIQPIYREIGLLPKAPAKLR
ncbi:MAG: MFS transporter, partial [Cyanobacteriota bacterium]